MVWPVMLDLSTVVDEKGRGFKASDSGLPNMLQCNFETGFGSLVALGQLLLPLGN